MIETAIILGLLVVMYFMRRHYIKRLQREAQFRKHLDNVNKKLHKKG